MNEPVISMHVPDPDAMEALGESLGRAGERRARIYLVGPLGAGKTTLVRGFIRGAGLKDRVKSPTYTLLEPYVGEGIRIYHFDFYRVADPEELEYIGTRDYFGEEAVCLVEWPERGAAFLPAPDLTVSIELRPEGRGVSVRAHTPRGRRLASGLSIRGRHEI